MEKTEMKTGDIVLALDEAIKHCKENVQKETQMGGEAMKVKDFLEKVAYKTTWKEDWMTEASEIYRSKFDGSYITHVGLEDDVKFLADREITEELTRGVGYSPKDNKWYGWNHRAIFGFTIGSTCKKGDVHYIPSNMAEMEKDAIRFCEALQYIPEFGRGEWVAKTMEDAKQMAIDFCRGIG